MDVARKILQNYGWKDGDGLGKNKDGIAKPLKATLKFDSAGFGADQAADDFNNHWWERVFNEAATNVSIRQEGEQVKLSLKNEENGVEISTKSYSAKKLKKLKNGGNYGTNKSGYDNFLRAATLTNVGDEIENPNKINTKDIEVSKVNFLTDEELFKVCGGRTAHKGARHGLKLSGKLLRIEQQEAELLAKMAKSSPSDVKKSAIMSETKKRKNKPYEANKKCEITHIETDAMKRKKRKAESGEIVTTYEELPIIKNKKAKNSTNETRVHHNNDMQSSNESYTLTNDTDKINFNKKIKNKKKGFNNKREKIKN